MSTITINQDDQTLIIDNTIREVGAIPDPYTPPDGTWNVIGDIDVTGSIVGGASPFVIRSKQSTASGVAFELHAINSITGKLLSITEDGGIERFAVDGQGITHIGNVTTAQRPAAGVAGRILWNITESEFQGDNGVSWSTIGGVTDPITVNGWSPISGTGTLTGVLTLTDGTFSHNLDPNANLAGALGIDLQGGTGSDFLFIGPNTMQVKAVGGLIAATMLEAASSFRIQGSNSAWVKPLTLQGAAPDSASSVAVCMDAFNNLTMAGAQLVEMSLQSSRRFAFDPFGVMTLSSDNINIHSIGVRTGVPTTVEIKVGGSERLSLDAVAPAAYTPTNVVTDRSYDANATTVDELADVLGTLIADLQARKLIG